MNAPILATGLSDGLGMTTSAKPILKWAGGKRQLLPEILKYVPEKVHRYYEPFVGGGAVFFELWNQRRFECAFLRDLNPEMVNMYREIRRDPTAVMEAINLLTSCEFSRFNYNQIRASEPDLPESRAARTIYLNKCGFNGLYRQNKSGRFNVPWNKREHVNVYDPATILAASRALRSATISCGDFGDLLVMANPGKGDLVYLDSPYVPLTKTSDFTAYTKDGFTIEDQHRVAQGFRLCANNGATVIASNSDTEIVRDLYRDFEIQSVQARRNINSKGGKRGKVGEVLIVANSPIGHVQLRENGE